MTDSFTPVVRALVVATLLLATATLMLVAVSTARAAGALAVGKCGAYGEAYDFGDLSGARQCPSEGCRVVLTVKRACAAFAMDYKNPCGSQGWAWAGKLGQAQNTALKNCYRLGGQDCVIRTFVCDAKG